MSMPRAGLHSLPLELLEEIITYVSIYFLALLNLRRVNKALCSLITPIAFRKMVVCSTEHGSRGFLELLYSSDIVKHIRVITFLEEPDSEFPDSSPNENRLSEEENLRSWQVRNHLRGAFSMLHLIPSLESLDIMFCMDERASLRSELSRPQLLQTAVLGGLACNPNPLPALQSLHINGWFALCETLYSEAPFKRIVESLRDLCFDVQHTDYNSAEPGLAVPLTADNFWANVIGPCVLRPAVNLTSLAMESTIDFASLISLDLGSITYPCLTSFSLSSFIWDDSRLDPPEVTLQAEEFIVRHGKTLKKLKLHNCMITLPRNRPTPIRSWTAVCNRFAEELTELVDLDLDYVCGRRYVEHVRGQPDYDPPCTEQDISSLEALATIVKGRKDCVGN